MVGDIFHVVGQLHHTDHVTDLFSCATCHFTMYLFLSISLEIPFLEFKRVFRSQCSGGNCLEGEKGNGKVKIHVEFK